jgi:hypothetical protein
MREYAKGLNALIEIEKVKVRFHPVAGHTGPEAE